MEIEILLKSNEQFLRELLWIHEKQKCLTMAESLRSYVREKISADMAMQK